MEIECINLSKVEQMADVSKSFIYSQMKKGNFPKAHKIGTRSVRWIKSEVQEWIINNQNKSKQK